MTDLEKFKQVEKLALEEGEKLYKIYQYGQNIVFEFSADESGEMPYTHLRYVVDPSGEYKEIDDADLGEIMLMNKDFKEIDKDTFMMSSLGM